MTAFPDEIDAAWSDSYGRFRTTAAAAAVRDFRSTKARGALSITGAEVHGAFFGGTEPPRSYAVVAPEEVALTPLMRRKDTPTATGRRARASLATRRKRGWRTS